MATELVYRVLLRTSEEGVAVQCPALPGCWSQGADEAEALENIADAIKEYLAAIEERASDGDPRHEAERPAAPRAFRFQPLRFSLPVRLA